MFDEPPKEPPLEFIKSRDAGRDGPEIVAAMVVLGIESK